MAACSTVVDFPRFLVLVFVIMAVTYMLASCAVPLETASVCVHVDILH